MASTTIREALQKVQLEEAPFEITLHEPVSNIIAHILFDIALYPRPLNKTTMMASVRAQKIISERLAGRRRSGTHPAQAQTTQVEFTDLTQVSAP